jgi:hypothetical protein
VIMSANQKAFEKHAVEEAAHASAGPV